MVQARRRTTLPKTWRSCWWRCRCGCCCCYSRWPRWSSRRTPDAFWRFSLPHFGCRSQPGNHFEDYFSPPVANLLNTLAAANIVKCCTDGNIHIVSIVISLGIVIYNLTVFLRPTTLNDIIKRFGKIMARFWWLIWDNKLALTLTILILLSHNVENSRWPI